MSQYRENLPQNTGRLFLTDGGLETTLIFHDGLDLPHFAAFDLLKQQAGRKTLDDYFRRYASIAVASGVGFILESATWRANADWGAELGYTKQELTAANKAAIDLLVEVRRDLETERTPMVISGCIGPRGDGYDPGTAMTANEARDYHAEQIGAFASTETDLVTAITMTNVNEAIGVTKAAQQAGMPVVVSFTVETDGHLPTGQSLKDAIQEVDAATGNGPAYYMINCAHPTHFEGVLKGEAWGERIRGLRANASSCSHAELDEAEKLDDGNPAELGRQFADIRGRLPHINVVGGCCGTDHRHIEQICRECAVAA